MFAFGILSFKPLAAAVCAYACAKNIETGILALDIVLVGNGGSPP